MKIVKIITAAALCASSLSPLAVSPALAITPNGDTTAAMEGVCSTDLAAKAAPTLHDGSPSLTVEVVQTGQSDGPTTEVPGSRVETPGTRFGTGTPTYSNFRIAGDPFRTGGSVNMFGDRVATNKNWPNSEYDFTADYSTTTTFSFNCEYTRHSETYIPGTPAIPAQPVQGFYTNNGTHPSGGEGSCQGINPTNPHWGEDLGNCIFTKTGDAVEGQDAVEEQWILNDPQPAPELTLASTVDETNVEVGVAGHEANAGPWTEVGNWLAEKVVICISPKKLPGVWTNQNGYTGTKCNTTYFNTAPWGGGSQTSNGTYISVPGV